MAVAASRVAERPIFSRRRGPAAGSDCDRAACADARCAGSQAADYRGPLHGVVRASSAHRDEVTRPSPRAHVTPCPRAPVPSCSLCPRVPARALAPCALCALRPRRHHRVLSVGFPSAFRVLTLFLPCSYLVLTLFLPCSYLVLTREGAFECVRVCGNMPAASRLGPTRPTHRASFIGAAAAVGVGWQYRPLRHVGGYYRFGTPRGFATFNG